MNNYCDINCNHEEGFADLTFDIINVKKKLFGNLYIECVTNDNGENVGFALEVKKGMKGIKMVDGNLDPTSWTTTIDGIKILYLKEYSDKFIKSLLKAYEFNDMDLKLNKVSPVECGCLTEEPADIENKKLDFKCFINSNCNSGFFFSFSIIINLSLFKKYFSTKIFDLSTEFTGL